MSATVSGMHSTLVRAPAEVAGVGCSSTDRLRKIGWDCITLHKRGGSGARGAQGARHRSDL